MAKKSARKEITKINLKQAALEGLSCERACETAKRAGKPSYRFTVGDKVQVGHLLNCIVDEALEGGYMYLIRSGANSDNYSCWAWTNVRPLDDDKDTHFAKRNSALSRLPSIGVAEIDQSVTRAEVLEIFLAMNEGGKPVAKEVLDHARELLNEEKGEGL